MEAEVPNYEITNITKKYMKFWNMQEYSKIIKFSGKEIQICKIVKYVKFRICKFWKLIKEFFKILQKFIIHL